jgi:hypothetical protein
MTVELTPSDFLDTSEALRKIAAAINAGGGGVTPATDNMTFYVDPASGSDTNPGTSGSPFKTIQHALDQARGFDYQYKYTAAVQLLDGVYNEANQNWSSNSLPGIAMHGIVNAALFANLAPSVSLIGNPTIPGNVVLDFSDGSGSLFIFSGLLNVLAIGGFHLKISGANGTTILINNSVVEIVYPLEIELISGAGGAKVFSVEASAFFVGANITISGTPLPGDFSGFFYIVGPAYDTANLIMAGGNLVFATSIDFTSGKFISLDSQASVTMATANIVNPSNIVGPGYNITNGSTLSTDVDPTAFVGTQPGFIDSTSSWTNYNWSIGLPLFGGGQAFTVGTLPAGPAIGMRAFVSDAHSSEFGSAPVGGGGVTVPVFFDGTNWMVG